MKNLLQMAIMFSILNIFYLGILPVEASTIYQVYGSIDQDETWTNDSGVYVLDGVVTVSPGAVLAIERGVVVKFTAGSSLYVQGSLIVQGSENERVYFTSIKDDSLGGDTNQDNEDTVPNSNDWGMVVFDEGANYASLSYLTSRYSSSGFVLSSVSADLTNFDSDNQIYFADSFDVNLNYVYAPNVSFLNTRNVRVSNSIFSSINGDRSISLYDRSNVVIKDSSLSVSRNWSTISGIYDRSVLSLENVALWGNGVGILGVGVYGVGTKFTALDSAIGDVYEGVHVNSGATADLLDTYIGSDSYCINSYQSRLSISGGVFVCEERGVTSYDSYLNINNAEFYGSSDSALMIVGSHDPSKIFISENIFSANNIGINSVNSVFKARNNSIWGNVYGAFNQQSEIDLSFNWWGSKTGPYHNTLNIYGQGNESYGNISYYPWLKYDPLDSRVSNVLFIPGFQGSRLYKKKNIPILGEIEDKLWEPNINLDVSDMFMDNFGESIDESIYTRDIVDKKTALGVSSDVIYESFMNEMDLMVSGGVINDWDFFPYDWRYDVFDVVDRGQVDGFGRVYYSSELSEEQDSHIISQISNLIENSKTGRVSLVAHSNGGLVIKALMVKLEKMKADGLNDYIDYIDKVIMIASPQIGTPKAIASILHGYDQELFYGLILKQYKARDFGIRLPGAYGLLPSEKYFNTVDEPIIYFDESLNKYNSLYKIFGSKISSYADYVDFLLANKKDRTTPSIFDINLPGILFKGIFAKSVKTHNLIDDYIFPENIKVHQLAGWGLTTVKSLVYYSFPECTPISLYSKKCTSRQVMDMYPVFTDDGDATVVSPSALAYEEGYKYFFNSIKHSDDFKLKLKQTSDHANMLNNLYVLNFIKNILNNKKTLPAYITTSKPASKKNLILYIRADEKSNKTATVKDRDGNTVKIQLGSPTSVSSGYAMPYSLDIPGSLYSFVGQGHYITLPYGYSYGVSIGTNSVNHSSDGHNLEPGTVFIRQDVIEGGNTDRSVYIPSVSVSDDSVIEFELEQDGGISDVEVDYTGDGVVDEVIAVEDNVLILPIPELDQNQNLEVIEGSEEKEGEILAPAPLNISNSRPVFNVSSPVFIDPRVDASQADIVLASLDQPSFISINSPVVDVEIKEIDRVGVDNYSDVSLVVSSLQVDDNDDYLFMPGEPLNMTASVGSVNLNPVFKFYGIFYAFILISVLYNIFYKLK